MAASEFLKGMPSRSLHPDLISSGAALSALEKSTQWESALGLLQETTRQAFQADVISCYVAISACEKGSLRGKALGILKKMLT